MPVEYVKFKDIVSKAEKVFGYLSEEQRKIYWENVKGFPEDTVLSAVDRVITTHGYYKFPTIAELLDAISDHSVLVEITPYRPPCPLCSGIGRTIVEYWEGDGTYYKERFCECDEGRRQYQIRAEYLERRRKGLTRADGSVIRKEKDTS